MRKSPLRNHSTLLHLALLRFDGCADDAEGERLHPACSLRRRRCSLAQGARSCSPAEHQGGAGRAPGRGDPERACPYTGERRSGDGIGHRSQRTPKPTVFPRPDNSSATPSEGMALLHVVDHTTLEAIYYSSHVMVFLLFFRKVIRAHAVQRPFCLTAALERLASRCSGFHQHASQPRLEWILSCLPPLPPNPDERLRISARSSAFHTLIASSGGSAGP